MSKIRARVANLPTLKKITDADHQILKTQGALDKSFWNTKIPPYGAKVAAFREEAKTHYYYAQLRACCYCSVELVSHHGTFDAEHIIDKDTYPQFMFELTNLAASCKTCNGAKSNSVVLTSSTVPLSVPPNSAGYIIVHPHFDEWEDYFAYDSIGRIVAKVQNGKATYTIKICGINYRNAARLSDYFYPAGNEEAERALNGFFRVTSRAWKRKYVATLRQMADDFKLSSALAIVNMLEKEI
jgi:uncharacterized protein (TIGR02646 family)